MYVTDETAECCGRWYPRGVGTAGWERCFGCKQPLQWRASGPGKLISKKALQEQQRAEWRRRRERREREKAERRTAREAAKMQQRFPLFADEFIAGLSTRSR
jgi:hypothetical protein